MRQLTLRVSDDLAARLKRAAAERGSSVNGYATAVLGAAVDPELAGDESARVRERLAAAGLLAPTQPGDRRRPEQKALRAARRRAGKGRRLDEIVTEGRR
jgi:hypothetical protein